MNWRPDRLREERTRKGLTQAGLAELVGVTPEAIGQYENGKREPKGHILVRLAAVLQVHPGYLTGDRDDPNAEDRLPDDWVEAVQEAMRKGFSPEDVRRALEMYRMLLEAQRRTQQGDC